MTSINTNIAAISAQRYINDAQTKVTSAVGRLASGNAIQRAADNVANLAIGTSLASNINILKIALQNTSQASSLLQVANGGLTQLTSILQRMGSLAAQAAAGSLDSTQRGFLNQEFQALTNTVNTVAGSTNFNGLNLLDGTLSQQSNVASTETQADNGTTTLSFSTNPASGSTVKIAGVTFYAGTDFTIAGTTAGTLANLAQVLNSPATATANGTTLTTAQALAVGQAIFTANGNALTIAARTGGALSNNFKIDMSGTATASGLASISGQFGGSYKASIFGTGFASSGSVIAAVTAAAGTPFQVGDTISAVVGTAGPVSLYTIQSSDTLEKVVNGINANTATTNIKATLVYDQASTTYNMRLSYADSAANISVSGGVNYNSGTYAIAAGNQSLNLLDTALGGATATPASGVGVAGTPFAVGAALTATIGSRTVTLATAAEMTASMSFTDLATIINTHATTTGVYAVNPPVGNNIALTVLDPTATGSLTASNHVTFAQTGFYSNSTSSTVRLNNENTTFALFSATQSGVAATTGASGTALVTGSTLSVTTSDGITVSTTVGASLAATVTALNAAAVAGSHSDIRFAVTGGNNITVTYLNGNAKTTPVYFSVSVGASGYAADVNASNAASQNYATGAAFTAGATGVTHQTIFGLAGGADNGLGQANTSVSGTVGDDVLTGLVQTPAQVTLSIPPIDSASLVSTLNGYKITLAGQEFVFTTTATAPNQITIGSSLQETLDNAVSTINNYVPSGNATGDVAYQLNQLNVSRSGNSLLFTGKNMSNVTNLAGTTTAITTTVSTATVTHGGTLDNASFGAIDATGVSNSAFTGTISGFTATYKNAANTVDLAVKVGDYTYTASSVNTNPSSNSTIRFYSNTISGANGGYFDVQLQGNEGSPVADQSTADTFGNRINAAFSSLDFSQKRNISSYSGTQSIVSNGVVIGSLVGSSMSAQLGSFDGAKVTGVSITAPQGGNTDASVAVSIGSEKFVTQSGVGGQLGSHQTYRLYSTTNANHYIDFTTGNSVIDLSSAEKAQSAQQALLSAFGADSGAAALTFQVGATSSDTIKVSIDSVTSSAIFNGQTLSLSTADGATEASDAVAGALNTVTATLANIGALQESFGFAANVVSTTVENQNAARSLYLDTDIASESTNLATSQVQLQAGISVLAQANQQLQNLLKLIG